MTIEVDVYCSECGQRLNTYRDTSGRWKAEWRHECKKQLLENEYHNGFAEGREEARNE